MEYIRSLRTGIMAEYPVMCTSQGTYIPIEQTSEAIRVTYEICRAGGEWALELRTADLEHWPQTQFLEGHSSAEFSSNQLQITPAWTFLVIMTSVISSIRCVSLGLELNCAELWPSRNGVWDQWLRDINILFCTTMQILDPLTISHT